MESPKRISKSKLLEMVRKEVEIQERKKLLENRISELNHEIYIISEGESGKNKKKDEDEMDEGLFQNIGRGISRGISGIGKAAQGIKQNFQQGSDQKSIEHMTSDIKQKEQELAQLKKDFAFVTGQSFKTKSAQNAVALPRNQQGVVKAPVKKQAVKPVTKQTAKPVAKPAVKQTAKPVAKKPAPKKAVVKKQTANIIPAKQGKGTKKAAE
jgi:hypothetical protein